MSSNSIYEKIEQKGIEEANKIKELGIARASTLKSEIIEEAKADILKSLNTIKERANDNLKKELTSYEQLAKRRSLIVKKDIIKEVINQAHQKLKELDDLDFKNLIIRIIKSNVIKGNETLMVSSTDKEKYVKQFSTGRIVDGCYSLDKLNKEFNDEKYQLKLSLEPASIDGGFIIIGENFDIDNSFKTLLEEIKENSESEIAKLLFEDGE